jgi:Zn-finger nucleic acid-binding protein
MNCPECHKPLEVVIEDAAPVHACPGCKGAWVGFDSEKSIIEIKPEAFTVDELRRLKKLYQPLGRVEKVKLRACPVCSDLMYRRNWGGHSGVIVDRCEKHGAWYDEGEIEKIREYIKMGGAEYEKLRIAERGLDELQSKILQESTRLDIKINTTYRNARLWSLIGF